jgi:hypothetical protein
MALKRLLTAEADKRPVLIVVENLELCESDTINFIQYLAAGLTDKRVAIVGTGTSALYERHPSFGDGEVAPAKIELKALTPAESEDLLRELCKQLHDVPLRLLGHVRSMGGSPRAIQELVRLLLESDVIVREGLMWRSTQGARRDRAAQDLRASSRRAPRVMEAVSAAPRDGGGRRDRVVTRSSRSSATRNRRRSAARRSRGSRRARSAGSGGRRDRRLVERQWLSRSPVDRRASASSVRVAEPVEIVYKASTSAPPPSTG